MRAKTRQQLGENQGFSIIMVDFFTVLKNYIDIQPFYIQNQLETLANFSGWYLRYFNLVQLTGYVVEKMDV